MIDSAKARPSLLIELESRQEEVLRRLDELNRQIEQAVSQSRSAGQLLGTGREMIQESRPGFEF